MAKVILGMTMSLDGFINDRKGSVGALYPDLDTLRSIEPMPSKQDLMMNYTLTSRQYSFAAVIGYLKISALNRFNWKD